MSVKYSNNTSTALTDTITAVATEIEIDDVSKFPTLGAEDYCYVTLASGLVHEIIKVTSITGNILTCERGVDGTTGLIFGAGASVEVRITTGMLSDAFAESAADAQAAQDGAELAETGAETAETNALGAVAAVAINWDFDDNIVMEDPTLGLMRLNHATIANVTAIAVSKNTAESGNPDVSDYVDTWDAVVNVTAKGTLILRSGNSFAIFSITGTVTDNTDWLQITVTYITGTGAFVDGNDMFVHFIRAGNDGTIAGDMFRADNLANVASAVTALANIGGIGAATTNPLTNKTFNADGTGNSITNVQAQKSTLVPKTANYTGLTADAGETIVMNGTDLVYTTPTVNATNHELVFNVQNINATDLTITTVTEVVTLKENESCTFIVDNTNSECRALSSHVAGGGNLVVGMSYNFNSATIPSGLALLKEDGGSLDTTTYAALFARIGYTHGGSGASFNKPDSRGRYDRCADATYAVGAKLASQNLSHTHTGSTTSDNHRHSIPGQGTYKAYTTGYVSTLDDRGEPTTMYTAYDSHNHTFTSSSNGGTEARPNTIVKQMCIAYEGV